MAIRLTFRSRSAGRSGRPAGSDAFRADPLVTPADRPSRRQATALLSTLVVVAAGVGIASYTVRPDTARTFDLVHGSVFLTDQYGPVGIDFATGRPTLRLIGAEKQVGADRASDVSLVPVTDGTLMIDRGSGEFNMVDDTGFVIKHDGGGVVLPGVAGTTSASAVSADGGSEADVAGAAYIVRTGAAGTDMLLVNQSTVEGASAGRRLVKPRALLHSPTPAYAGQNGVAGANGDLWVLLGSGERHDVEQLSVPLNSDTGAALKPRLRGRVDGPGAIGTATTQVDGSGGTAVVVASARRLVYFPADGSTQRNIALPDTPGLTDVVPVAEGKGRFAFLLHGTRGWALVTLSGDGSHVHGPVPVQGLATDATLAPPTWSEGQLYTIDRAKGHHGRIYQVTAAGRASPVDAVSDYPIAHQNGKPVEAADFNDAYVVSRGSRVLVNSPTHSQAVALFTGADDPRQPLIIRKSSAVDVSVAGGAEALTKTNIDPSDERDTRPSGGNNKATAGTQINTGADCKNTVQKPHIPVLSLPRAADSRSATLGWTYPTLGDPQACFPVTWQVRVTELSSDTLVLKHTFDGPPGTFVSGLLPDTRYAATVTAYLNGQGTTSPSVPFSTAQEGPAAPTGLRVSADSAGNWNLAWNGCGSSRTCVPVERWQIEPTVCDSLGPVSPPTPTDVSADASTRTQQTHYSGGTALLGRGLSFRVVGQGAQSQGGDTSANSGCVYSWRPPNAGAITVGASQPQNPSADGTTSVTASVQFAGSAVAALGGVGGTLTYSLLSGGAVVDSVGPTTDTSVRLDNIEAGQTYSVAVTASPPRHPEVVVAVGTAAVQPAIAPWPAVGLSKTFVASSATAGTLTVAFGLGGTSARGEHFDLVNSVLVCGSLTSSLDRNDVTIGQGLDFPVDRFNFYGNCTVTVQLRQNADHSTNPPLFGAGPSGTTTIALTIPSPDSTAKVTDFTAQWDDTPGQPAVVVGYSGSDLVQLISNWRLTVSNGQQTCGSATDAPPVSIPVDPANCITQGGTFTVSVSYTYAGSATPHFDVPVTGTAPKPIDPDLLDFSVAWGGDATTPTVDVTYDGQEDQARLTGAAWTESVTSGGAACGSDTKNPGFQVISVPVDLTQCPPGDASGGLASYVLTIGFTDIYGQVWTKSYDVAGEPPS